MAARNFPSVSNLTHHALYRVTDNLEIVYDGVEVLVY